MKKLIEVALPLDKINEACAREKSIRHGHPSTLHLWWARRPLAAARAVIWASLVDDPSSHPELFPTEEEQNQERQRLFGILDDLVVWENSNNEEVLQAARDEILKYNHGEFPTLLDPFAGGGAIPLEAQRLGLKAIAHDLNPVAVMINKAMIEIPPRFAGRAPVSPDSSGHRINEWHGAQGLAEDVRYYGEWMKQEAFKRIGYLYPKVKVPEEQGGGEATVIAWIWARTVKCPNPACGAEAPLIHSFAISKKKKKEAYVKISYTGKSFKTHIVHGKLPDDQTGTISRQGAVCACCGSPIDYKYLRAESIAGHMSSKLIAVVAQGKSSRLYLEPDEIQRQVANVSKPENYPKGQLAYYPGHLNTNAYGLNTFDKLFTNRQLTALVTFSSLVNDVMAKAEKDALAAGMADDHKGLDEGGQGAKAYGEAVGVYLAFLVDKLADLCNSLNRWEPIAQCPRQLFSRQAIPMVWDYAEGNPFSKSSGSWNVLLRNLLKCLEADSFNFFRNQEGIAQQADAQNDCGLRSIMVSTDPPYYDNIGYADLSDFFYVWMRQSLRNIFPSLFSTMLVPKLEELIATPYRHDGSKEKAKKFFEEGMLKTCKQIYIYTADDIPVTIYYAYKQDNFNTSGDASGWESMLNAIIQGGFAITGTWPMNTECSSRAISQGTNALASSIILVCRKRKENAPLVTRRNFISELRRELHGALKKLQGSNIAPVDLAQASIGPGMGIFSKYQGVLEADGSPMTVRSALQIINEQVDAYFNEQVGTLDTDSRFCVDLYMQCGYHDLPYGEAELLANAKGASISRMVDDHVLYAKAGIVHLVERKDIPPDKVKTDESNIWLLTQRLTRAMETGGIEGCAKILFPMLGSNAEYAKDLAYRLYTISEQKKWGSEAFAYNTLVVSWQDIQSRAAQMKEEQPEEVSLFDFVK